MIDLFLLNNPKHIFLASAIVLSDQKEDLKNAMQSASINKLIDEFLVKDNCSHEIFINLIGQVPSHKFHVRKPTRVEDVYLLEHTSELKHLRDK